MGEALLVASHVSKTYHRRTQQVTALKDVSLSVESEEFIAIMGRSGSGKSTLLSLLGGLDVPSKGDVFYGDANLRSFTAQQSAIFRRHTVGYLFQSIDLLPSLSVLENVALPGALDGSELRRCRADAQMLLNAVGLEHLSNALPDQLSGGERQRAGIARALMNNPRMILADEPTGSLDHVTGSAVMALLKEKAREYEAALIIVTHDSEIAQQADRTLVLQDGQLEH